MAQPKALLAIGAGAVVAAGIVLVIALKQGDGANQPAIEAPGGGTVSTAPPTAKPGNPGAPVIRPSEVGEVERVDRPPVVEYEVDGVKIRDHRKNPGEMKLPPNIHPPESRRLAASVVNDVHQKVRALAPECAKSVAAADRGAKPKIDMQVVVSIKDKQVTVGKATVTTSDVNGAAADAVKACMEQKSLTVATTAPDEPDVERYSINLSMPLP